MITGADLVPFRDRLAALIAAAELSEPPVQPPAGTEPALSIVDHSMGCTNTVFFDGFDDPSTIDWDATCSGDGWTSTSTMTPPVKWAVPYLPPGMTARSAGYKMQNSLLHIAKDPHDGGGFSLSTQVYPSGANRPGQPARGFAFKGPKAVVHVCMAVAADLTKYVQNSGHTWPAGWSMAQAEWQIAYENRAGSTCGRADGSYPKHMELDFIEIGYPYPLLQPPPAGQGRSVLCALNWHECNLSLSRPYPTCDWGGWVMTNPTVNVSPAGYDDRELNTYSTTYEHPSVNGGVGLIQRFITRPGGVPFHCVECDDSWAAGDPYWATLDDQMMGDGHFLIIGAGDAIPADFDFVCVRQPA